MLTIRAIYYEPRPVGLLECEVTWGVTCCVVARIAVTTRLSPGLNNDLYTSAFNNMHERDLYIMRHLGFSLCPRRMCSRQSQLWSWRGVTCAWNGWCAHPQQAEEHTPRECCQTCTLGLGAGPFRFPARLQEVWNVPWPAGYIAAVVQPPVSYRVVQGWPYGVGLIEVPSEMVRGRALPVSSPDRAGLRFRSFTGRMHGPDAGCNIIGLYQLTSLFVKLQMLSRGPSLAGHFQESTVQG